MNFTTLSHTDNDDPYLYHNYEIEFSDQILADANGKTRTLKYGYSIPTAQARKGARLDSDGNAILRVVNQRIPDSDEAEELLRKSTNVFQPGSNLHQLLSEDPDIDFSEYEDEEIILQSGGSCTMIKEAVSCFLNFYEATGDLFVYCYDDACLGDGYGNPEPDPDPPPLPPGPDPGEGGGGSGTPPGDSGSEEDICNDPTLIMLPPACHEEEDEEEETPCAGDPIVDPQVAPSNGWNYLGGQYGYTRNNGDRFHDGIDIKAALNSELFSMHAGVVVNIRNTFTPGQYQRASYGNTATIESQINGNTIHIMYSHLNNVEVNIGDNILQGGYLGLSGDTGNAQSTDAITVIPHVHIRAREIDGDSEIKRNPAKYMATTFNNDGSINESESNCN